MCKIEPNCLPFEIIDKFLKSISFHLLLNSCAKEQYLVIKKKLFKIPKRFLKLFNKENQMRIIRSSWIDNVKTALISSAFALGLQTNLRY